MWHVLYSILVWSIYIDNNTYTRTLNKTSSFPSLVPKVPQLPASSTPSLHEPHINPGAWPPSHLPSFNLERKQSRYFKMLSQDAVVYLQVTMYLAPRITKHQKNEREEGKRESNDDVPYSHSYSTPWTETFSVTTERVKDVAEKITGLYKCFSASRFSINLNGCHQQTLNL